MFSTTSNAVASDEPPSMAIPQIRPDWKEIVSPVAPFLDAARSRLNEQVAAFDEEISPLAADALGAQGKQLRPALVALSAGCFGAPKESHVTAAVIVEMIHLATLVHDDVMDEARIRRKRPTLGSKWGNATAVLLGDCLFAQALRLAAGFPTTEVCRVVSEATNTVCAGEILQTSRRRSLTLSIGEYFRILEMKTGELFAVSCELGALLADEGAQHRAAMRRFGLHLGTAYQIFDDCLDLFGNEAEAGKSLGTDLATGKLTLPVLVTLDKASPGQREAMMNLLRNWRPEWLGELQGLMDEHGAVQATLLALNSRLHAARTELAVLPETGPKTSLIELCGFLQEQAAGLAAGR